MSTHYVSVECRHRSPKSRRRLKKPTEIKQEPAEEVVLGPVSPPKSVKPPPSISSFKKKSPKNQSRPKMRKSVRVKTEKVDPVTQSLSELPSISDDLDYIQQNIKQEADEEDRPRKRGKKRNFPAHEGHKCEFCGRIYKYRKGMLQHQRLECGQDPQFPCPYCPLKFRYRHLIRNHVYTDHNQAFKHWYNVFYTASKLPRWPDKDKPNV
ncbi:hypothetical protein J6590_014818 [Homalodisca vitripennis]|nr:hypothetical protein J6590_014818 [Homalodisca vitripennis]